MRINTNRVLDIYLDTYPITAIYIGTELYYERQTGAIAYTLSGDGTYYIVVGEGSKPETEINIANEHRNKPVKEIAKSAFSGKEITSLTIPKNITKIGESAFWACGKLQTVTYNAKNCEGFNERNNYPFRRSGNNLTVTIGNDAETIPAWMFADSYVKKLVATGTALKTIGDNAFRYCENLSEVSLSDNITHIGENAFKESTGLTTVTIPKNIENIEPLAFTRVSSVYYYGQNAYNLIKGIYEDGSRRFAKNTTINISKATSGGYPQLFNDGSLVIPYNNYADVVFRDNPTIKRLIISRDYSKNIYKERFASCRNLKEIWIPLSMKSVNAEGTKLISLIEEGAFTGSPIEKVYFEGTRSEWEIVSRQNGESYGIGIPYTANIYFNRSMYKFNDNNLS